MTNKKVLQICSAGRGFPKQGAGVFLEAGSDRGFLDTPQGFLELDPSLFAAMIQLRI